MKNSIVYTLIIMVGAIAAGWIYQSGAKNENDLADMEIPSDIDYFLSGLSYRVMNRNGLLDYDMTSAYLEHFIVADISRIEAPDLNIYRTSQNWQINSQQGELFHLENSFQLSQDVVMRRNGDRPLLIRTDKMLFEPDLDLVSGNQEIEIIAPNTRITASSAIFNLERRIYSFTNVKAVYHREDS